MSSLTPNLATMQENSPVVFNFDNHNVRVVLDDNQTPMFVAKDVAKVLGYQEVNRAIRQHCKGCAKYTTLETEGGNQKMRVIYEPDVYRLIFGSKLKSAVKFQDWVFEEVLPQIRKTGQYQHYALLDEFNKAVLTLEELEHLASQAGRALSVVGKQLKPKAKDKLITLQAQLQFTLPQGE